MELYINLAMFKYNIANLSEINYDLVIESSKSKYFN